MSTAQTASPLVAIDGIVFSLQRYGGISVYFRELLSRLRRDAIPTMLTLEGRLAQEAPRTGTAFDVVQRAARPLERYRCWRLPAALQPAVFHSTYYRRPEPRALPSVVTVHDFTYERFARGPRRWIHSRQKFAAIRSAQEIVCVSQATLDDLHEFVGVRPDQRTHVVWNGVSEGFRPLGMQESGTPFVLFVGQRDGYKNFRLALRALELLPDIELRCVGGGPIQPRELDGVLPATRRRVRHLGFVTDDALNALYNQALCLAYPSRYEGFGIPVVEAMRAGCPVVSIPCKAVLEIGGDALTIAQDDPSDFARAIRQSADAGYRVQCVARGALAAARFSWEESYRGVRQIYAQWAAGLAPNRA